MGCLGNVLWFVFGGCISGLSWCLAGLLWCVTIVGIPVGMQCFKFAALAFFPFGKEVQYGGRGRLPASQCHLDDSDRNPPGSGISADRLFALCHSGRYSFWNAAF